jgi:solute carrier family 25 (mitochondrial aspartate/glutamate transporter), member 12/13
MSSSSEVSLPRKIIYSGLSGAIATTCIYPIDITKTKLMNQKGVGAAREFEGPVDCFKKILQREGFRGLYRGWPPNVLFVMPEKAIKLTANDFFRSQFTAMRANKDLPLGLEMLAGGLAGFCQVIMTNPMELLKIQGATMQEKLKSGELKEKLSYTQLCRNLKISGLYTGVAATLLRDVPFSMIYFSLYAQTKRMLTEGNTASNGSVGLKALAAGAIAGTAAAAVTCPVDVIKTRVHASATPIAALSASEFFSRELTLIRDHTSSILQKEGAGAFFKGIVPRCAIISPLFAITMSCYEKFQQIWK